MLIMILIMIKFTCTGWVPVHESWDKGLQTRRGQFLANPCPVWFSKAAPHRPLPLVSKGRLRLHPCIIPGTSQPCGAQAKKHKIDPDEMHIWYIKSPGLDGDFHLSFDELPEMEQMIDRQLVPRHWQSLCLCTILQTYKHICLYLFRTWKRIFRTIGIGFVSIIPCFTSPDGANKVGSTTWLDQTSIKPVELQSKVVGSSAY